MLEEINIEHQQTVSKLLSRIEKLEALLAKNQNHGNNSISVTANANSEEKRLFLSLQQQLNLTQQELMKNTLINDQIQAQLMLAKNEAGSQYKRIEELEKENLSLLDQNAQLKQRIVDLLQEKEREIRKKEEEEEMMMKKKEEEEEEKLENPRSQKLPGIEKTLEISGFEEIQQKANALNKETQEDIEICKKKMEELQSAQSKLLDILNSQQAEENVVRNAPAVLEGAEGDKMDQALERELRQQIQLLERKLDEEHNKFLEAYQLVHENETFITELQQQLQSYEEQIAELVLSLKVRDASWDESMISVPLTSNVQAFVQQLSNSFIGNLSKINNNNSFFNNNNIITKKSKNDLRFENTANLLDYTADSLQEASSPSSVSEPIKNDYMINNNNNYNSNSNSNNNNNNTKMNKAGVAFSSPVFHEEEPESEEDADGDGNPFGVDSKKEDLVALVKTPNLSLRTKTKAVSRTEPIKKTAATLFFSKTQPQSSPFIITPQSQTSSASYNPPHNESPGFSPDINQIITRKMIEELEPNNNNNNNNNSSSGENNLMASDQQQTSASMPSSLSSSSSSSSLALSAAQHFEETDGSSSFLQNGLNRSDISLQNALKRFLENRDAKIALGNEEIQNLYQEFRQVLNQIKTDEKLLQ